MQTKRSEDDIGPCSIIFCLILKTRSLWIWRQVGESSWFSCLHLSQHWGSTHTQSNQVGFYCCFVLFLKLPGSKLSFLCWHKRSYHLSLLFCPSCCLLWKLRREVASGQFIPFRCCILFYCMILYLPTHINWWLFRLFGFWLQDCCCYEHSFNHKPEDQVLFFSRQYIKSRVGSCTHHVLLFGELPKPFLRRLHQFVFPKHIFHLLRSTRSSLSRLPGAFQWVWNENSLWFAFVSLWKLMMSGSSRCSGVSTPSLQTGRETAKE